MATTIFEVLGGLMLFLFGINFMEKGLKSFSPHKTKKILKLFTKNKVFGMFTGLSVTAIIQSSSATTVMLVGLVSAGMIAFEATLPVILGANIGTTITAQLIAFKLTKYSLMIVSFGGLFLIFLSKNEKLKQFGQIVFGFGMLFHGLNIMASSMKAYENAEYVRQLFISFGQYPIYAVLLGIIATVMFQSSSVTIGITITLASTGFIPIESAVPIILGENIGTCITAILASINKKTPAKRVAYSHALFNTIGVIIALCFLQYFVRFATWSSTNIARQIANTHTFFNICITLLFLPFTDYFALLVKKILPEKDLEDDASKPKYLDDNLLETPSLAITAITYEISRILEITQTMIDIVYKSIESKDPADLAKIEIIEENADNLQKTVIEYLVKLNAKKLDENQANIATALSRLVNDAERSADKGFNLSKLTQRLINNQLTLSDQACDELKNIYEKISQMVDTTQKAFRDSEYDLTKKIYLLENEINYLVREYNDAHMTRLCSGICQPEAGYIFTEILEQFEKIGDDMNNFADAIKEKIAPHNNQ